MLNYSKIFDIARDIYSLPAYVNPNGNAFLPLRYFFELTYRCNLKCPYCYVGSDRNKNELSTSDWERIIAQIPAYSFVTLVGGEPLIREDFVQILKMTSEKTFGKVSLVTNGILLDEKMIDELIKNKLMLLSVSLDGFGENHDKNRNREELFEKVTSNLDILKTKKNTPKVDIKTIVLENNLDDLPKLYKYCTKNGFDFLSISFLRTNNLKQSSVLREDFSEEFFEENDIKPYFDLEHFKEIYKELESLRKNSSCEIRFAPKFEYSKNPLEKIEEFFTQKKEIKDLYKPCKFPFSNTFITPEGLVYPCLSVKIGDLKEKSLKEIYNSSCYKNFRKSLKKEGIFPACQMCCELCLK